MQLKSFGGGSLDDIYSFILIPFLSSNKTTLLKTLVLVGQEHTDVLQNKAMNALLPLVCSLYQVNFHSITQIWAQWIIGDTAFSVHMRFMGDFLFFFCAVDAVLDIHC